MAEYGAGLDVTLVSEWDLRTKQYCPVYIGTGNQKVIVCSQTAQGPCLGVLQSKPESGRAARIRIAGTTKFYAQDTITRGAFLQPGSASGVVVGNSGHIVGVALEGCNSGSNFMGLITPANQATA
jgi:hypothetical protein